jgi:glycine cleavage system H protein
MGNPKHLKYTKEHEWVEIEGTTAKIGITAFAQSELGDIVFVEVPEPGKTVRAGDTLGTIESVKAVSEIYAPLSGKVIEGNSALVDAPETVNRDPFGAGWLAKIEIGSPGEVQGLLDADAYDRLTGGAGA